MSIRPLARRLLPGPRLRRTLAANAYGQGVTLVIQLATIPLFIAAWGLETFGVWLLLAALPAMLAFCDLGFAFVAKNDMTMRAARGDRAGAQITFHSVALLLVFVLGIGGLLFALGLALAPPARWLAFGPVPLDEVYRAACALLLSAWLQQVCHLLSAGVRAVGHPAAEATLAATARLAESLAAVTVALLGGGIGAAGIAWLAARVIATVILFLVLRHTAPWLDIGLAKASRERLAALLKPALGHTLIPVGNALLIHGPVIVLGALAGPAGVALYAVTRTVARLGIAGGNMLAYAFTPEYSIALGADDRHARVRNLLLHARLLLAGLVLYLLVMALGLPWAVAVIARGAIAPDPMLAALLVVAVCLELLWTGALAPIAAGNAHLRLAIAFAVIAAVCLLAAIPAATPVTLAGAVAATHAAMLVAVAGPLTGLLRAPRSAERPT